MQLFMTTDTVGGVWTYAIDLARALQPLGVVTTLATLGPAPSADQREAAAGLHLIETDAALDWLAETMPPICHAARLLAGLAAEHAADVIQLNSPALAALASWPAPVIGACHSCLGTWWDATHAAPLREDLRWRADLIGQGYGACDMLVAPSRAFAAATEARHGRRPAVVHNGRPAPLAPHPGSARARCVLTAGRLWDTGKNLATLDEAAARIDAPLHAAGALAAPDGAPITLHHARPLGQLGPAALRTWMDHAAIFASLPLYEPFGLSVLEAAQSGCALVLSDIASLRELWDGAAIFVPAQDAHTASVALQALLDDPVDASRRGAAAYARSQQYGADAMARGMLDIYRALPTRRAAAA